MSEFRKKTVSGFKWTAINTYGQKILSFVTFIILSRILSPADFGLFAMAFIVIDGLNLFKNMGIDTALIQKKDFDPILTPNTAFWTIFCLGCLLLPLVYFIAPLASNLMNDPQLTSVLRVLGFIYVIGSLQTIPEVLFSRELQYKAIELRGLVVAVVYSIIAVILAKMGMGVWSLVWAYVIRRGLSAVLTMQISNYRPKFVFSIKEYKSLIAFGKYIFGVSLLSFVIMHMDNFFIGKMLGAEMLGYYALALNLSNLMSTHFVSLITRVMFPAYAKIQDDKAQLKNVVLKVIRAVSMIAFPFSFTLIILGELIVFTVYGQKWLPIVPVLQILAINSFFAPITSVMHPVYVSCGKPQWSFQLMILTMISLGISLPLFIHFFGIQGAAMASVLSHLISIPIRYFLIRKLIDVRIREFIFGFQPYFIATLIFIAGTFLINLGLNQTHIPNGWHLLILLLSITLMYGSSIYWLDRATLQEIRAKVFKF